MSKIYREAVVLGVATEVKSVVDYSSIPEGKKWADLSNTEKDALVRFDAVKVTFLACDFACYSKEQGYWGDLKLFPYNYPVADKEILKQFKPNARLLLGIEQTIISNKQPFEKIVSVQPMQFSS